MQLSFSHIMKHWKRNPTQPGLSKIPGSPRNVLLRFYPPQSVLGNFSNSVCPVLLKYNMTCDIAINFVSRKKFEEEKSL